MLTMSDTATFRAFPIGASSRVFLLGDVHGRAGDVYDRIYGIDRLEHLRTGDVIVFLGDVGVSYGGNGSHRVLNALEEVATRHGVSVLVMRGNHDDRYVRDALRHTSPFGDMVEDSRFGGKAWRFVSWPHVTFLDDAGGLYVIAGRSVLVVPGAYSVDKGYRVSHGLAWEPEEQLDAGERKRLLAVARTHAVDAVLSHTCPLSWFSDLGDLLLSGVEPDNTMEAWLDEVLAAVSGTCREWWFGHFHSDRDVNGIGHLLYLGYGELGGNGVRQLPF